MLDEDEEERVDETALRQLTEMGFPESRAVKALRLNQYVCRRGWSGSALRGLPAHTPESGPACEALYTSPASLAGTTRAGQNSAHSRETTSPHGGASGGPCGLYSPAGPCLWLLSPCGLAS